MTIGRRQLIPTALRVDAMLSWRNDPTNSVCSSRCRLRLRHAPTHRVNFPVSGILIFVGSSRFQRMIKFTRKYLEHLARKMKLNQSRRNRYLVLNAEGPDIVVRQKLQIEQQATPNVLEEGHHTCGRPGQLIHKIQKYALTHYFLNGKMPSPFTN